MSNPLTPEDATRFSKLIDDILSTADLATVTRKRIRSALEERVDADLSDWKNAIKVLIEERFDAVSAQEGEPVAQEPSNKRSADDYEEDIKHELKNGTSARAAPPARKRAKRDASIDDDAKLAAQLQAQENLRIRARRTRNGTSGKPTKKTARRTTKKSKAKVDDSDVEAGGGSGAAKSSLSAAAAKRKKAASGKGLHRPFNLSEPLASLLGHTCLSRPQVVKYMWQYIRREELADPQDKRNIICDDKMQAVFKTNRVNMFSMNKAIGTHLYPLSEEEFEQWKLEQARNYDETENDNDDDDDDDDDDATDLRSHPPASSVADGETSG